MNAILPRQEWMSWPATQAVVKAFAMAAKEMRFVGGCVRNALLGRVVEDVDIATSATPQEVTALLEEAGIKVVPTGIAHGTVTAVTRGKHFEITTLRRDESTDGRHAKVAFTDNWKEDAARRDFTMNALYATPKGELMDYWGGREDALAGRVKFIGDARTRIREDGLRILRFFRFFAHYGKGLIDETGLAACTELKEMIDTLSGERLQAEMLKLLAAERAPEVLGMMRRAGILEHVLPDVGIQNPEAGNRKKDQSIPASGFRFLESVLRLALLLRSTGEGENAVKWVAARWKISGALRSRLEILVAPPLELAATMTEKEQKKTIRVLGADNFADLALLRLAEEGGAHEKEYTAMRALAHSWQAPVFPVTGKDLLKLGFSEGKELGTTLAGLEDIWEEGDYKASREELLRRVKK